MAITTLKTKQLTDAGLDKLFAKSEKHWLTHAKRAFNYMAQLVDPEEIHPDDLIATLVVALELDPKLSDYLDKNGLKQKYWFTNFGEYIVDEVWDEL
jgi:hypothetical protein